MNIEKTLILIYSRDQRKGLARFIEVTYSIKGLVPLEEVVDLNSDFKTMFDGTRLGPFETEEELKNFSLGLSTKLRYEGVCLVDSELLNRAYSEVSNIAKLNQFLFDNGDKHLNPEPRNKGIFSKFF
ncbi:hypothetical protein [Bacteriovorax sp. Seq25_V]|uniref:hypothetical protein n=1 Tax=Bacteriovorax sp. Seq25_V TaxID=1201288 RepID=UPI00038A3B9A|nr:hypothetical protein [Bacteriovorax sp. Seq25_V]EQC45293.1 hypothetical protein M900_2115 [Bacteriovorax sp. Seq25_V]